MKKQFVESMQEGDVVNDYFVAIRRDLRDTQNGGKFLGMVFKDRTGEIGGILWNNAASVASQFDLGDIVNVRGTVKSYQSRLQVRVDQVLPLKEDEYDIEDLTDAAPDMSGTEEQFRAILATIEDPWVKQLVQAFLDDNDFMTRFLDAAAGKKWHHAHRGGLLRHCCEMARIAERVAEVFPNLNRDLLLAGVFLHDIGKTKELGNDLFIDYTDAGKLVGHLEMGCAMVRQKIDAIPDFPDRCAIQVLHMILAHHGELVNGSPVVPKTLEAMVLYHIDNLDAQADAFTRIVDDTRQRRQDWSEYINLIGRQVWAREGD